MKIASFCGALTLDDTTLTEKDGVITPVETLSPTGSFKANCGILFCTDDFKMVGNVITSVKNETDEDIEPMTVPQQGCGGLLVDGQYFKYDKSKFGLSFEKPQDPEPEPPTEDEEPTIETQDDTQDTETDTQKEVVGEE